MKITEVITESEQVDEISGKGVGTALGKTAHAVSGALGGLAGAWDAGKAGFQSGRAFVGGQRVGKSSPKPSGGYASGGYSTRPGVGYSQVVDAIPNMNADELKNLKQKIDTALAQPQSQPTGGEAPAASGQAASNPTKAQTGMWTDINGKKYMFAGQQWVDERDAVARGEDLKQIKAKLAAGEIPPPTAERPPELGGKPQAQAGSAGPVPDQKKIIQALSKLNPEQVETIRTMLNAKVQGQQNVAEGVGSAIKAGWNKLKNLGGLSFEAIKKAIEQMTPEDAKNLLSQLPAPAAAKSQTAGAPAAGPATTQTVGKASGAAGQNIGVASPSLGAPTLKPRETSYVTTKIPGQAPAPQAAPKAAPAAAAPAAKPAPASPYGKLTPDEQAFVAAREKEGVEPETIKQALANRRNRKPVGAPQGGPEKTQAKRTTDYDWYGPGGVNPSTKLSDLGPVGAAAKKRAANEGFYSKFLGKDI